MALDPAYQTENGISDQDKITSRDREGMKH